jgi:CCR4-NOT transcriptional regulation complex NOT5 subunit
MMDTKLKKALYKSVEDWLKIEDFNRRGYKDGAIIDDVEELDDGDTVVNIDGCVNITNLVARIHDELKAQKLI